MRKNRTKRFEPISSSWSKLVYTQASIEHPTRAQQKALWKLWFAGYSHKDAAKELSAQGRAE